MTLKARIKALTEVDEPLRPLYAEKDGEFVLMVEGMVPKEKLDEFRNNNVELKKQLDAVGVKYEGIDPEEARKLIEKATKERDKKLIDAGKVDELVAERTNAMKAEHEKQVRAVNDEKTKLQGQMESLVIDNAVRAAAAKSGVLPSAVDDVLWRARNVFKLVDGKAVAMDGDKPIFGKTGQGIDIEEWVSDLGTSAPHLYPPSQGGGTPKGGSVTTVVGAGKVARNDDKAFLTNLDAIASGKTQVV